MQQLFCIAFALNLGNVSNLEILKVHRDTHTPMHDVNTKLFSIGTSAFADLMKFLEIMTHGY